jgi:hypothetical protein
MDDSKIFSNIHGAYKESFEILQGFGIFGAENMGKLWTTFIVMILLYPPLAFIFGYKSIDRFGDFVEHTAVFVLLFGVFVQLVNVGIRQNKIIKIAELFQELKKFDESDIVKKSEIFLERTMKIWLDLEIFLDTFYCIHQHFFNGKLVFCEWIEYHADSHLSLLVGIVDWTVAALFTVFWINTQKILFMAYTQLTAHLKCLNIKFPKIEKPKNAGDSKENLEKLHEIFKIHQKLKRYTIKVYYLLSYFSSFQHFKLSSRLFHSRFVFQFPDVQVLRVWPFISVIKCK